MTSYTNLNLSPITLDSMKAAFNKAMAETETFRRPKSETVKCVHASRTVIEKLKSMAAPVVVANRFPDNSFCLGSLQIKEQPMSDGTYAIEYEDGHLEYHGKDSP